MSLIYPWSALPLDLLRHGHDAKENPQADVSSRVLIDTSARLLESFLFGRAADGRKRRIQQDAPTADFDATARGPDKAVRSIDLYARGPRDEGSRAITSGICQSVYQWGYGTCKINTDLLGFAQITDHRAARIAESSRPQQGARPITIFVTSGTSDRPSLAPPAASRLCASWQSTATFELIALKWLRRAARRRDGGRLGRCEPKAECGFVKHEPTIRKARIRSVDREGSFRLAADRPRCQRGSVVVRLGDATR